MVQDAEQAGVCGAGHSATGGTYIADRDELKGRFATRYRGLVWLGAVSAGMCAIS